MSGDRDALAHSSLVVSYFFNIKPRHKQDKLLHTVQAAWRLDVCSSDRKG